MAFQTDREAWAAERNRIKEQIKEQHFAYQLDAIGDMIEPGISEQPSKELFESLKAELQAYRAAIGSLIPSEQEALRADQWITAKLLAFGIESQASNELDRLVKGFAVVRPFLDSNELSPGEKSALLKLFENSLWKTRRCGILDSF